MDKSKANIKIGSKKLYLSIPVENERVYHLVGQELDRLYYVYKARYPLLKETELYATIAYVCALQKAGINIKEPPSAISYCKSRWRTFLAVLKQFLQK